MPNPRDHAQHPLRAKPGAATDTAGAAWAHRHLSPSGFENDTGASDPALLAVLAGDDETAFMGRVMTSRFLVAVVSHTQETAAGAGGLVRDVSVEMALVTLVAPDGRRALPAFTGVAELSAWNPGARPVPITAQRLAQAALEEACDVVVVNAAGPVARELRGSQLRALATRRAWAAPERDPVVCASVGRAVATEPDIGFCLYAAPDAALGIELVIPPGRTPEQVRDLLERIGARMAADEALRERVDGLAFRLGRPGSR